jgi:hypothetical protein
VDEEGKLIGINFGYDPAAKQGYTLTSQPILELLPLMQQKLGDDMGISGVAVPSLPGIWENSGILVANVQPDSYADNAGILPGDLILFMGSEMPPAEAIILDYKTITPEIGIARDSTLAGYCSSIQGQNVANEPLDVILLRKYSQFVSTNWKGVTVCRGQLNGATLTCDPTPYIQFGFDSEAEIDGWDEIVLPPNTRPYVVSKIEDSQLKYIIKAGQTYAYQLFPDLDLADVRLETIAENTGEWSNSVTLVCRFSIGTDGFEQWYEFNISSRGFYNIMLFDGNQYTLLDSGASKNVNAGFKTNTYVAICKDTSLEIYANGTLLKKINHSLLTSGGVGVSVSSYDTIPVAVGFLDFIISQP